MGKIISPPKMPEAPPPAPVPEPAPAPAPVVETPVEKDPEISADEQRVQSILNRRRGLLGNITTSFRGVLNNSSDITTPARKTLLGE